MQDISHMQLELEVIIEVVFLLELADEFTVITTSDKQVIWSMLHEDYSLGGMSNISRASPNSLKVVLPEVALKVTYNQSRCILVELIIYASAALHICVDDDLVFVPGSFGQQLCNRSIS